MDTNKTLIFQPTITPDDCYMMGVDYFSKEYYCGALNNVDKCGMSCPFRKTAEQQLEDERKCVDRLIRNGIPIEYRSTVLKNPNGTSFVYLKK